MSFLLNVCDNIRLWDSNLSSYKQLEVKDAAWKDILKKTNIASVTQAKIKWKNLRDTHREKLKKIKKTKSGQFKKPIKPWKYMSHMEFLLPHTSNTNAERDTNVTPLPDISPSLEERANKGVTRDPAEFKTVPKKSKTDAIIHCDKDTLLNFLKEMEDNQEKRTAQRDELRKELTSGDALKAFFDSMYQSTKQMPEFYQRTIKRNLFQLVMDAEENIANTNYSHSDYFSNDYAYNSRPSTNQTNYTSRLDSTSPEPSGSGSQQIGIEENTTRSRNEETQDSKPAIEITISDEVLDHILP